MTTPSYLSKEDIQFNLDFFKSTVERYEKVLDFQKEIKPTYRTKLYKMVNEALDFPYYDYDIKHSNELHNECLKCFLSCFTVKGKLKAITRQDPKEEKKFWWEKKK